MKVLQVTEEIYPNRLGGVGKHVYDLSVELINNGIDVKILVKNLQKNSEVSDEVQLANNHEKVERSIIKYTSLSDFYRLISTYRFDVVHFHQLGPRPLGYLQNDIAQFLAKKKGFKIVNTPHGAFDVLVHPPCVESTRYPKLAMDLYLYHLTKISLKWVDKLIAVNPHQVKIMEILGIPKRKIELVPNGIQDYYFEPGDKDLFLSKYNLQDKRILLYVGRVAPRKRVSEIIEILPNIIKKHEDVVLVVIGPDKGSLRELQELTQKLELKRYILFLGAVSEKEKIDALASAYLFINPSEYEAFGITVLEAMAQGTPVISSDNEGAKYLLENGKYGLLYPIGNKEELSRRILSLLDDERKAKEFANKGRKRAEEFKWKNIADKLIDVYSKLIS